MIHEESRTSEHGIVAGKNWNGDRIDEMQGKMKIYQLFTEIVPLDVYYLI